MHSTTLKSKLTEMSAMTRVHGGACAEMWDGHRMVWVKATCTKHNRVNWSVEERRVARADIPKALGIKTP